MKAIILAAGKGNRLRPLTDHCPKPMVQVAGKPILQRIIEAIALTGITDVTIITGYFANVIEDYFRDGSRWELSISYIRQETQDGTGGALKLCRGALRDSPFLLTFGDILIAKNNYARIIDSYNESHPCAMLGVNRVDDPYRGAAVYFEHDSRRITEIIEKPMRGTSTTCWNQAGLFAFSPKVHDYAARIQSSERGEYELTSAIHSMLDDNKTVRALTIDDFWGEIGTPEDVEKLDQIIPKLTQYFV